MREWWPSRLNFQEFFDRRHVLFFSFLFPKNVKEYKLEYCVFTIKEDIVCCYPRRYLICILCNIIFRKLDLVMDQVPNPGLGKFWRAPTFELSEKMVKFGQINVESLIHLAFFIPFYFLERFRICITRNLILITRSITKLDGPMTI